MLVKMIQNFEIKMESQINSLEARIEKMQERFNKDLEEIKKSQYTPFLCLLSGEYPLAFVGELV